MPTRVKWVIEPQSEVLRIFFSFFSFPCFLAKSALPLLWTIGVGLAVTPTRFTNGLERTDKFVAALPWSNNVSRHHRKSWSP